MRISIKSNHLIVKFSNGYTLWAMQSKEYRCDRKTVEVRVNHPSGKPYYFPEVCSTINPYVTPSELLDLMSTVNKFRGNTHC